MSDCKSFVIILIVHLVFFLAKKNTYSKFKPWYNGRDSLSKSQLVSRNYNNRTIYRNTKSPIEEKGWDMWSPLGI